MPERSDLAGAPLRLLDRLSALGRRLAEGWWRLVAGHPVMVIVATVSVVLGMGAYGVLTLQPIDNTVDKLMTTGDPNWEYFKQVRKDFGSDDICTIALAADDVFTPEVLAEERLIHDTLEKLVVTRNGKEVVPIHNVMGLTGFNTAVGSELGMRVVPVMDEPPKTQEGAEAVRERALRDTILNGSNVSPDCRVLSVEATVSPAPPGERSYGQAVADCMERLAREIRARGHVKDVYVNGESIFNQESSRYTTRDLTVLLPLAGLIMILVVCTGFRSVMGVLMPILTPVGSLLCTVGFVSLTGSSLTVTTSIVPVIIVAMGAASTMHVIAQHGLEGGSNGREYVLRGMHKVGVPALICALTTMVGFMSNMTFSIVNIRELGLYAAFGIAMDFLLSVSLVPAILTFYGRPISRLGANRKTPLLDGFVTSLARFAIRKRWWVMATGLALAAASAWGVTKIVIETDYLRMLKYDDPLRASDRFLDEHLTGQKVLMVTIRGREDKAFYNPEMLRRLQRLHDFATKESSYSDRVKKVSSFLDFVCMMNRASNSDDPAAYAVPEDRSTVARYVLNHGHPEDMKSFILPDYAVGRVFVRTSLSSSKDLEGFNNELQAFCDRTFGNLAEARAASSMSCLASAQDSISWGQIQSLMCATGAISLLLFLMFRSFKLGLVALPSNVLPIVMLFGVMGFMGTNLDVGTSIVGSLGLGVAVDNTVHLMARYLEEVRSGKHPHTAIEIAVRVAGRPLIFNSVGLLLAFLPLLLSDFVPVIYLGFYTSLTMLLAMVADVLVTPAVLAITTPGAGAAAAPAGHEVGDRVAAGV